MKFPHLMTYLFLKRLPSPPQKKKNTGFGSRYPPLEATMTRHPPPPELRPKLVQCPVVDEDGRQEGGIFVVINRHNRCFYTPNIEDVPSQTVFWWIVQKTKDVMFLFDIINFFVHWFFVCFENKSHVISPFHSLNDVISNWLNLPSSTLHRPLAGRGSDRIFVINLVPELQNNGENWSAMYIYTWVHIRAYVSMDTYMYTNIYIYMYIYIYTDGLNIFLYIMNILHVYILLYTYII